MGRGVSVLNEKNIALNAMVSIKKMDWGLEI